MRTGRALLLVTILLLMPLSNLSQNSLAVDSSIQVNTTWSGSVVLTGNVTVSNGSTLTLSPGTTVDGGDGYWIRVDGTLVANSAEFFSSQTPLTAGSHGAGLWTGIYVANKGHAVLDQVTINNAKTAVKVDGHLTDEQIDNGETRWEKVYYNPYTCDTFIKEYDASPIENADYADLSILDNAVMTFSHAPPFFH